MSSSLRETVGRDGCATVRAVVSAETLERLRGATEAIPDESKRRSGGVRNALASVSGLGEALRNTFVGEIVSSLLGPDACVVRSILFDKTAESNWLVPWHRDETIAVAERIDTPGFGPWSVKNGTPHVRPPREVLDHMVTIRLHLDDCLADNGALRVMSGSHEDDAMEPDETHAVVCEAMAGDAVIMKPRTLHASAKAVHPARRRVLHLECAAIGLPGKLQWAEAHPLRR